QSAPLMQQMPMGMGTMLLGLDLYLGPHSSLLFTGEGAPEMANKAQQQFLPRAVVAARNGTETDHSTLLDPVFADRQVDDSEPRLWVCQRNVCQAPVVGQEAINQAIPQQ